MNIEKMREEFEFAIRNGGFFHDVTEAAKDAYLERGSNGQYRSLQVNGAWWGWQASRESLVIELPVRRAENYLSERTRDAYNLCMDRCQSAIEAAGVKVAP